MYVVSISAKKYVLYFKKHKPCKKIKTVNSKHLTVNKQTRCNGGNISSSTSCCWWSVSLSGKSLLERGNSLRRHSRFSSPRGSWHHPSSTPPSSPSSTPSFYAGGFPPMTSSALPGATCSPLWRHRRRGARRSVAESRCSVTSFNFCEVFRLKMF